MASENEHPDDEYRLEPEPKKAPPPEKEEEPTYALEPVEVPRGPEPADFLEVEEPKEGPSYAPVPPAVAPDDDPPPREPDEEEEESGTEPPTVQPFEALRFLLWPLRKGCGDDFLIMLFIVLVVLSGGWLLSHIPAAGPILQGLVAFAAAVYLFTYLVKLTRATAEGRSAPVVWVQVEQGDAGVRDGLRASFLFLAHLLPAFVVGAAVGSVWAALPLVLLGWAFWPATLLNLAAAGPYEAMNPVAAVETAMLRRGIYFRIVMPGLFFTAAAFLSSSLIGGLWFGLAMWLCFVYTALAIGSLAFHDRKMAARVRKLSGVETGDEEDFPDPEEE